MISTCRFGLGLAIVAGTAFGQAQTTAVPANHTDRERPSMEHSNRWELSESAVLLSDMSVCTPTDALSDRRKKGYWKVIPYETASFRGQCLSVFPQTGARAVTLPLGLKGWHAVYVGVGTVGNGVGAVVDNGIRVKLSGEAVYRRRTNKLKLMTPRRDVVEESFLTCADLTGQDLHIAPMYNTPGVVMYVKMVPLTESETAAWKADSKQTVTKRCIATFDGHTWIWPHNPTTREDLLETFADFDTSDFGTWWFQVTGADLVNYPSKIGTVAGTSADDFPRPVCDDVYVGSVRRLVASGINPLQVAVDAAHATDREILVMLRVGAWGASIPLEETFCSRFYHEHPEWRTIDRDGTPAMFMSYAVPEVRQHLLDLYREILATRPDGVGLIFQRGMPMMLWEDAFCDEFRRLHGVDAKAIPEDDPRIYSTRANIMTAFMRDIRTLLNDVQKEQGRKEPLKIAVSTFSTESDNRKFGLDVEHWAQEGLVDQVGIGHFAYHTSFKLPVDVAYYKRITDGTGVRVYPFVISWKMYTPDSLAQEVAGYYAEGADGIAVWDARTTSSWLKAQGMAWPMMSRLGHRDEITRWAEGTVPAPTVIPLTRYGENHFSRWFPNTGY